MEQQRELGEHAQEAALQSYFKQINTLVTEHNLIGTDWEELKRFATDQTHIVLPRLNGHRKGSLVLFLHESGLIDAGEGGPSQAVIRLHTADLTGADLRNASLVDADLSGADLRGVTLYESSLWGANLRGADLSGADCSVSDLVRVDFSDCTAVKGAGFREGLVVESAQRRSWLYRFFFGP